MHRLLTVPLLAAALATGGAAAKSTASPLEYKLGELGFRGYLAKPEGAPGKRPGVLVVHDWLGLTQSAKDKADELADMGYVALAVDMYGGGQTALDRDEAAALAGPLKANRAEMRARINAALDALLAQPGVDPARVAAIGFCFGGTTVLELARSGAPVAGVVSFHGNLDAEAPEDAKKIQGKVLVLHGADDPLVPPPEVEAFFREMRSAKVDWQFVAYGNAVHSFTNPLAGVDPSRGAAYEERAARRSWEAMRAFFREIF